MLKTYYSKTLLLTALAASAFAASAKTMPTTTFIVPESETYLLFEAGAAYSYAIYQNSVKTAESYTLLTPNGVSMDPSNFYPNNFWGGYIELSLLRRMMMYNIRYDMFSETSKSNSGAGTKVSLAPSKLSFTIDKVWGCLRTFSYGLGAGVVIAAVNDGHSERSHFYTLPETGQYVDPYLRKSIQGRTRIDPLIEAFGMYHISDNINLRLNVAYQIPVNNQFTDGSINVNLGINYALPI